MTLFQHFQNLITAHEMSPFVELLLRRLSISEVIAATKFKKQSTSVVDQQSNIQKKISQKYQQLNYPAERINNITNIFKEIVVISNLIQEAWLLQSQTLSEQQVQTEALALASSITASTVTNANLRKSIQDYCTNLTDQLMTCISTLSDRESLNIICSVLNQCFPQIDCYKLEQSTIRMSHAINELISSEKETPDDIVLLDVGEDGRLHEQETVRRRGVAKHGIFQPRNSSTESEDAPPPPTTGLCLIS